MLLKPSASTYELGRQALRSGRFNLRRGWNFTGPPQRVLPLHSLQAPFGCVGSPLFRGRTLTCAEWAQDELNHTVMVRENEGTLSAATPTKGSSRTFTWWCCEVARSG